MKYSVLLLIIGFQLTLLSTCIANDNDIAPSIGSRFKLIDKKNPNVLSIYLFMSPNNCSFCREMTKNLFDYFDNDRVDFKVVFSSTKEEAAKSLGIEFGFKCKALGDEGGLLYDYYRVNYTPLMMVFSSDGILRYSAKFDGGFSVDSIRAWIPKKDKNTQPSQLVCLSRIEIKDGKNPITTTSRFRQALVTSEKDKFYIRDITADEAEILVVDSSGKIEKRINSKTQEELYGCYPRLNFAWAVQDSSIFMFNSQKYKPCFHYYNIPADTVSKPCALPKKYFSKNYSINKATFLTGLNKILISIPKQDTSFSKPVFQIVDTLVRILDSEGHELGGYGKSDSVFNLLDNSMWCSEYSVLTEKNEVVSIQMFSDVLTFRDDKFNLIKSVKIDLKPPYRKLNFFLKRTPKKEDQIEFENLITRTKTMLYDRTSRNILILYMNETYPADTKDIFSPDCITEQYIVLYDINGKLLNDSAIRVPMTFIPFLFEGSIIYGTEINEKNYAEIVKYKILFN